MAIDVYPKELRLGGLVLKRVAPRTEPSQYEQVDPRYQGDQSDWTVKVLKKGPYDPWEAHLFYKNHPIWYTHGRLGFDDEEEMLRRVKAKLKDFHDSWSEFFSLTQPSIFD